MLFWIAVFALAEEPNLCPDPAACITFTTQKEATWALVDSSGTVLATVEEQQQVKVDPKLVSVVSVTAEGQRACVPVEDRPQGGMVQLATPEVISRMARWNNGRLANDAVVTVQCGPYVAERVEVVDGSFDANALRDEDVVVGAGGAIARWRHGMPVLADPGPVIQAIGGDPIEGVVNTAYPAHPSGADGRIPEGPGLTTQLRFPDGSLFNFSNSDIVDGKLWIPTGQLSVDVPADVSWTLEPEDPGVAGPGPAQGPRSMFRVPNGALHFVARQGDAFQHTRIEVGDEPAKVEWASPEPGKAWRGRIVGADGKAVAGEEILGLCAPALLKPTAPKASMCRAETDADGAFELRTTATSPWTILFHEGHAWMTTATADRVYRLASEPPSPLKGTLEPEGFRLEEARWVLQKGDLLVAIDGVPTSALAAFPAEELAKYMGAVVAVAKDITVRRGEKESTLQL